MEWRQVVKVLAVTTQVLTAGWLLVIEGRRLRTDEDAAIIATLVLSTLVLVINLAKSLRSIDTELSALEQELEKAELRLKLHNLKAQSQQES